MARPVDPFIFPSNQSGADLAAPLSPSSRKPIPLRLGSGSQQIRRREKDSNPRSPVRETFFSNPLIKWQRAAHNERNDQVLDAAKFKQGDGANEAGFGGIAPKDYWK